MMSSSRLCAKDDLFQFVVHSAIKSDVLGMPFFRAPSMNLICGVVSLSFPRSLVSQNITR